MTPIPGSFRDYLHQLSETEKRVQYDLRVNVWLLVFHVVCLVVIFSVVGISYPGPLLTIVGFASGGLIGSRFWFLRRDSRLLRKTRRLRRDLAATWLTEQYFPRG